MASRQRLKPQRQAVNCRRPAQDVDSGVPSIDVSDAAVVLEDQYREWHVFFCVHFGRSASLVGAQVHPVKMVRCNLRMSSSYIPSVSYSCQVIRKAVLPLHSMDFVRVEVECPRLF